MDYTDKLIEFIGKSTDAFHTVKTITEKLDEQGFERLSESEEWKIKNGGKYYVVRNSSSVTAFKMPKTEFKAFTICASHTDSPCLKLKPHYEIKTEKALKLSVEAYGGMIMSSWLDRPLSVSGRVITAENGKLREKLVNIDKDLVVIPSVAIHLNREINKGYEFNVKRDLCPLAGNGERQIEDVIAENAGVKKEDILGFDLMLYNRMKGTKTGAKGEYFSAPRIDDLQCVYASLEGFLRSDGTENVTVFSAFDNEEVGSGTKQGAGSFFLRDTLERICGDGERLKRALAKSFMLSCDNAHALHPNYSDMSDSENRVYMNGGIVLKYNANQNYTTDAVSEAVVKYICKKADIPYQRYANRSDMPGGSTLGNLSNEKVPLVTADVGLAQLAMHSAYETAGSDDTEYMVKFTEELYKTEALI